MNNRSFTPLRKIEWFFDALKVLNNLINKPCLTIPFMKNRTVTNFP